MNANEAIRGMRDVLQPQESEPPPTELLTFFYLLVRDALPAGEVVRLVREAKRAKGMEATFTSAPLERLARDLLAELAG